jgi:uncharacterized membrane protein (DUF485 family)
MPNANAECRMPNAECRMPNADRRMPTAEYIARGRIVCYTNAHSFMNQSSPGKMDVHSEAFLHSLMRRQLKLSITCAATFLIALLGLPLVNYFYPDLMARRVLGFTLTWFILGVLFFPLVWAIAYYFIKRSMALEEAEVREVEQDPRA